MPPASSSKTAKPPPPRRAESPAPPPLVAPTFRLDATEPGRLDRLLNTEWLLTNGLGGFAMGTVAGVPARRYHGLLIAAAKPPVDRIMALNAMVESLALGNTPAAPRVDLSTFRFNAQPPILHPKGVSRLLRFEQDLTCRWIYEIRESGAAVEVTKELHLLDGLNAAQLRYRLRRLAGDSDKGVELRIRPLVSLRDFHGLIRRNWADRFSVVGSADSARVAFADHPVQLHLRSDWATFASDSQWWFDFFYESDAQRGQDCVEDLFSPGEFTLRLPAATGEISGVVQASIAPLSLIDASRDLAARRSRLSAMTSSAIARRRSTTPPSSTDAEAIAALARAADAYVIAPPPAPDRTGQATVIAGYPWFADWGRDTSISIPGLMLATGRVDDAGRCLRTFASHRKNGIVPNVFDDRTGEPQYNTADASLWFILGACAFRRAIGSGDRSLWDGLLAPACLDIISHYRRGTDFNIAMDPQDKLITAGTSATQLTWMDAKRDGVTFTPRHGKAVEINALWHSALLELGEAIHDADASMGAHLRDLGETVGRGFRAEFWNASAGCLYDCLTPVDGGPGWRPSTEIRPNQLFAISLPHSPLSIEQQRSVLAVIRAKLLTPCGVRTLDPGDPNYRARYEGNLFERDRAYHNGTAWPWLLGPFAEATLRVGNFSEAAIREARAALGPILSEMLGGPDRLGDSNPRGCLGQIAEIYDGDAPQRPQGCPAQAWSIAEVLRVMLLVG